MVLEFNIKEIHRAGGSKWQKMQYPSGMTVMQKLLDCIDDGRSLACRYVFVGLETRQMIYEHVTLASPTLEQNKTSRAQVDY